MALSETLAVPIIAGGTAFVGSKYLLGNTGTVNIASASLDKNLVMAGVVTASSYIGETSKNYVIPRLPSSVVNNPYSKAAVTPVLCGTATATLEKAIQSSANGGVFGGSGNTSGMAANFALGAGSQIAASYVYDTLMKR